MIFNVINVLCKIFEVIPLIDTLQICNNLVTYTYGNNITNMLQIHI